MRRRGCGPQRSAAMARTPRGRAVVDRGSETSPCRPPKKPKVIGRPSSPSQPVGRLFLDVSTPSVLAAPSSSRDGAANDGGTAQERRKASGAFYTPPRLARVLSDWALHSNPKRI